MNAHALRRPVSTLAATALVALGATWASSIAHASPSTLARSARGIAGVVPARGRLHRNSSFGRTANLRYWGGPVMHTNQTYTIYWVPSRQSTYTVDANYKFLIDRFFTDVANDSGQTSNVYDSDTQYYDWSGYISYSSSVGGSVVDSNPFPQSGCSDPYTSVCLTDAQIQQEIGNVITAQGWEPGPSAVFFMLSARGVGSCFDGSSSSCAFTQYCAYHSSFGTGSTVTLYANIPYADTVSSRACDAEQHPNGNDADATINLISHEHNEAITDPLGNAWFDRFGQEDGDKCAWNFGTPLGNTIYGAYKQVINGHPYYLQQEWSNLSSGCVLTGT